MHFSYLQLQYHSYTADKRKNPEDAALPPQV